jgi:hypothetical protein
VGYRDIQDTYKAWLDGLKKDVVEMRKLDQRARTE